MTLNYAHPDNVKYPVWINCTDVFCICGQLFIGYCQMDVFALLAVEIRTMKEGIVEFRTTMSDKIEKKTNSCNTFVHVFVTICLSITIALCVFAAVKERQIDKDYKLDPTAEGKVNFHNA